MYIKILNINCIEGTYEHITINQHKARLGVWLQERAGLSIRIVHKNYMSLKYKLV